MKLLRRLQYQSISNLRPNEEAQLPKSIPVDARRQIKAYLDDLYERLLMEEFRADELERRLDRVESLLTHLGAVFADDHTDVEE